MDDYLFPVLYTCIWTCTIRILYAVLPECALCTYMCMANALLCIFVAYYSYPIIKRRYFNEKIFPANKAVFITGCDCGFGHELAERLDSKGFHVFASCLFPDGEGAKRLKQICSDRLRVLGLDVTKNESVQEALNFVKKNLGSTELWAVVNNAGIWKGYDVLFTDMSSYEQTLDVNTYGVVRVSKAFFPLLVASKGRYVNITSYASHIGMPHSSSYNMSKFATRAFCETFRQELKPWGVKIVEIEPEGFKTNLVNESQALNSYDKYIEQLDNDLKLLYGKQYFKSFWEQFGKVSSWLFSSKTHKVVDDLEEAVCNLEPCRVYKPRRNMLAAIFFFFPQILPTPIIDTFVYAYKWFYGSLVPEACRS